MKKLFISILCLSFTTVCFGQSSATSTTIGLTPFEYAPGVRQSYAQRIYNHTATLLSNEFGNLKLVDRSVWGALTRERSRQDDIEFRNSKTYEQGKSAGAETLIRGYIYEARLSKTMGNENRAIIKMHLSLVDVTSGETIAAQEFTVQKETASSKLKKTNRLFNKRNNRVNSLVNESLNVSTTLFEGKKDAFDIGLMSLDIEIRTFFKTYYPNGQSSSRRMTSYSRQNSEPLYYPFFVLDEKRVIIKATKEELPGQGYLPLALVALTPYKLPTPNGDYISGTNRKEVARFRVSESEGDRTVLKIKRSRYDIQEMMDVVRAKLNGKEYDVDEPKFFIMPIEKRY